MSGFDRSVDSSVGETRQLSFTWKPDSFHTVAPHSPHPWKPKKSPAMADMGTGRTSLYSIQTSDCTVVSLKFAVFHFCLISLTSSYYPTTTPPHIFALPHPPLIMETEKC